MAAASMVLDGAHPALVVVDLESVFKEPLIGDVVSEWRQHRPNMLVIFVAPDASDPRYIALVELFARDERVHHFTFGEIHESATWALLVRHHLTEQVASTVGADFHRRVLELDLSVAAYDTVRLLVDLAPTCTSVAEAEADPRMHVIGSEAGQRTLRTKLQRAGQLRAKAIIMSARLVYYVWLKQQGKAPIDIAQAMNVRTLRNLTESIRRGFDVSIEDLDRVRYDDALDWLVQDCVGRAHDPYTTAESLLNGLPVRAGVTLRKGKWLGRIAAMLLAVITTRRWPTDT